MRRESLIKSFKTRAKNLKAKARELRAQAKGDMSRVGDRLRREAKEASAKAKSFEEKAKTIRREIRAEKAGITPGEQAILDRLQTQNARVARARRIDERRIPVFSTTYVDTVKELVIRGRGGSTLNTKTAVAIAEWIADVEVEYGANILAYVFEKAVEEHPYIFDSYIYQSDQTGRQASETLQVLNAYARDYIENYTEITIDENELEVDDDFGASEINY